ncbi:mediator subunit 8 [Hibiscus trionum]|uniref:Mediator subunit 8 n=1 Tax=Hibiscus trionum TaxID=183268 RepID=A0A9W7M1K1_HIBTR|nr:mediator subunit 8 [Hibiscus trionum]
MEGRIQEPPPPPPPLQQNQAVVGAERLNQALQQQLNLESLKTRAISLSKIITRILEELYAHSRSNTNPKWQDILGKYSMVNLELFNIVNDIKQVSKAYVVHPKNVNAENARILPVMLSSKLIPEMEVQDNLKREQLLLGIQNLPIPSQIEKLKARIDMIAAACESAEEVLADTREAYRFRSRQGPAILPTLDKEHAAKIQEQENLFRAAVNFGEGLRLPADQKQITPSLPPRLVDIMPAADGAHSFTDSSGMYMKNTPLMTNNIGSQGSLLQATGAQLIDRPAASPAAATSATSFDNTTTSPLPYADSPSSGTTTMNTHLLSDNHSNCSSGKGKK